MKLASSTWGTSANTLWSSALALCYSAAEYCAPVWSRSAHTSQVNVQPGFNLPRQQWSLLNRFRTKQGHCGACRMKWGLTDTDLCPCGETQTMSHIVESCPLTKLNGGLISATLCGWRRCFVADQLWLIKHIREEKISPRGSYGRGSWPSLHVEMVCRIVHKSATSHVMSV